LKIFKKLKTFYLQHKNKITRKVKMSENKNLANPVNLNSFSKSELEQFFNQFDVICTDCDGKKKKKNFL
jgi:hypothetical protein